VLQRTYGGAAEADIPKQVLVPVLPDDAAELEEWLRARRGRNVSIQVAQRGRKADLMKTASLNAQQALMLHKTRRTSDYVARTQALTDLQEALDLAEAPLRIECFDVSHLSGTNVVASMVVFEDGLPRKDQYRSFKVEDTTDDTDSLYQVLTRRLAYVDRGEDAVPEAEAVRGGEAGSGAEAARSAEDTGAGEKSAVTDAASLADEEVVTERRRPRFAYRPQLLVVDGGKPQVEAAARALRDAGHEEIALCGIAKRLEEVWLPGEDFPVILPRTSEALYLLQRLRDEAHRFAITHQRKRRRRDIQSVLAEIPGLGEARIRALLRHFGSVAALKQATVEQIEELPGVGPKLAASIRAHLAES
jgi:excinuclease ABC subunit C